MVLARALHVFHRQLLFRFKAIDCFVFRAVIHKNAPHVLDRRAKHEVAQHYDDFDCAVNEQRSHIRKFGFENLFDKLGHKAGKKNKQRDRQHQPEQKRNRHCRLKALLVGVGGFLPRYFGGFVKNPGARNKRRDKIDDASDKGNFPRFGFLFEPCGFQSDFARFVPHGKRHRGFSAHHNAFDNRLTAYFCFCHIFLIV